MPVKNYSSLKNKTLALFFTLNVSLKTWNNLGMIDREVALYNELSSYFKHIYFFTYGGREDLTFKGYLSGNITIVPIPFMNNSHPPRIFFPLIFAYSLLLPLIHYKILKNTDFLKTNQMSGSWSAAITKSLFGKKFVVRTGYAWSIDVFKQNSKSFEYKIITIIEKIIYRVADSIIVTSQRDMKHIEQNCRLNCVPILIQNYINIDTFKPLPVQKRKNSICSVGRIAREKNLFSLLEALISLPYTLTIIGSGPQRKDLQKYAKEKGVDVEFLGNLPNSELPKILNQHEMFVLPSFYEGMPKALLEAMACGLPVIGTDVEGIREVIRHEKNGILCRTDSVSIRQAILRIMNDEELRKKIGSEARITIKENFSLNKLLRKELSLYVNLAKNEVMSLRDRL